MVDFNLGFMDCNEWCGDDVISLNELLILVCQLQMKYGKEAKIQFDAGHNNVSVLIKPTKQVESEDN